jgi:hypothetical protein
MSLEIVLQLASLVAIVSAGPVIVILLSLKGKEGLL